MKPQKNKKAIQLDGTFNVHRLERQLAAFYNKEYCLLLCNATMGLFATALMLSKSNFHFIAPAFGWSGSISGMLHFGNTISFVDVDERFCMDPNKIEELILPDTKVIISIDSGGNACDSKAIAEIAKSNKLLYISDSAESLGALRDNKPAGAFADVVILSFTSGKTINAGEMGAVLTNNKEFYSELIRLTQHPYRQKKVLGVLNWFPFSPLNGRVHPTAAISGDSEFKNLTKIVSQRQIKALNIIKDLNEKGLISNPSFPFMESTFFEYYGFSTPDITSSFDKYSNTNEWYIDRDLSNLNLFEQTQKFYPNSFIDHNSDFLSENNRKMAKIQFNW